MPEGRNSQIIRHRSNLALSQAHRFSPCCICSKHRTFPNKAHTVNYFNSRPQSLLFSLSQSLPLLCDACSVKGKSNKTAETDRNLRWMEVGLPLTGGGEALGARGE